jgi:hypothetical protein
MIFAWAGVVDVCSVCLAVDVDDDDDDDDDAADAEAFVLIREGAVVGWVELDAVSKVELGLADVSAWTETTEADEPVVASVWTVLDAVEGAAVSIWATETLDVESVETWDVLTVADGKIDEASLGAVAAGNLSRVVLLVRVPLILWRDKI